MPDTPAVSRHVAFGSAKVSDVIFHGSWTRLVLVRWSGGRLTGDEKGGRDELHGCNFDGSVLLITELLQEVQTLRIETIKFVGMSNNRRLCYDPRSASYIYVKSGFVPSGDR